MQDGDTWSYTYDLANRLTEVKKNSITIGAYAYDANGIRAKKVENGATTHYLALGHQVMYEETEGVPTKHIYGGGQRIVEVKDSVISFFHNDHLGSARAVTDAAGTLVAVMVTKPFGEPHTSDAPTDYLFTGKELDDTNLYYFAARYYDPSVGRFISQDTHWNHHNMIYGDNQNNRSPLISAITQSANLYVYCANNPLGYVDPDGQAFFLVTGGIGAIFGGIGGAIHSYVKHGEVRWQSVVAGAAIGGAIGLTGGAATAYLTAGSATASTSSVLAGLGLTGQAAIAGAAGQAGTEAVKRSGQIHHVLSNKIMAALDSHPTLRGVYNREAIQFKIQAFTESAHRGYQTWHRVYDNTVVDWLRTYRGATTQEFIDLLNALHATKDMIQRFGEVTFK